MSDETLRRPLPYALNRPSISMAGTWTCRGKKAVPPRTALPRFSSPPSPAAPRLRAGSASVAHLVPALCPGPRSTCAAQCLLARRGGVAPRETAACAPQRCAAPHKITPMPTENPSGSDIAGRSPNRGMVLSRDADGYTGIGVVGIAREVATAAPGRGSSTFQVDLRRSGSGAASR